VLAAHRAAYEEAAAAAGRPDFAALRAVQADRLRDILGNPFRRSRFDARWRTEDVIGLARGIDAGQAFDRLPLLGDALMDAGCNDEIILAHCRSAGPHVRGCWVVELALGTEDGATV
jgi:hypothetical protein